MITLGLVADVDADGIYVTLPGSRGVLRGPFETLQNVVAGDKVLVVTTDDGDCVVVGLAAASAPAVVVPDGSITSAKIANGTIMDEDINASAAIAKTKISGTAITAADSGTVTSTMIADGTIVNADIAGSAAIDRSKISGLPTTTTDNAVARFDGTTGALQNSGVTVDDNSDVMGVRNLHASGAGNYIRVSSTTAGASVYLDGGASGQWSQVMYRTIVTGVPKNRWSLWKTDTSESGSDAGSDLKLTRYNDAGSSLGDAVTVTRSSGKVTIHTVGSTAGLEFGASGPRIMAGTGSPEGVVSAPVGSLWLRTDSSTTLYVKQTGTGNTGWVAK